MMLDRPQRQALLLPVGDKNRNGGDHPNNKKTLVGATAVQTGGNGTLAREVRGPCVCKERAVAGGGSAEAGRNELVESYWPGPSQHARHLLKLPPFLDRFHSVSPVYLLM